MADQTKTPLKDRCEALMLERVITALDRYIAQQRELWAHLLTDEELAMAPQPETAPRVA